MAKHWSVTSFAAFTLISYLAGKCIEAQKGGPPPQHPQDPPKPQYPSYPQPQRPQEPAKPQYPSYPQPQRPQEPAKPQYPSYPQPQKPQEPAKPKPQDPQYVSPPLPQKQQTFSDMGAKKHQYPSHPQPQWPQEPAKPKPQTPYVPPQLPQKQQTFSDMGAKKHQYPSYPQPQRPQDPPKPHYHGQEPQEPEVYYDLNAKKNPNPIPQKPIPQNPKNPHQNAYVGNDQFYQTPKVPPQKPNPQTPSIPPVKSCDVERNVRVPCGVPDIPAQACDAIDCCYDGQQCYFGRAVTLQCTKDGHFIVVVARDVTLPHIDLETISLLGEGQGCSYVDSNSAFAIYYFPVTACGSVVMEEPGVLIYENRMTSSYEVGVGPLGAITRDSSFELLFQCRYIGTSVETLIVEVLPLDNPPLPVAAIGPIRVDLRLGNGQCTAKGCNEVDVAYTSYFTDSDYPVTKILRDPVYVEVRLLEKTDPALVLTLGRCWATTSPNAFSFPQWDILIDGCPYTDDRYLSSLVPVEASYGVDFPSHYRRFMFKMFTFVDPNSMEPLREQVYIHCSTAVCVAGQGYSCEPQCYRKSKRDTDAADKRKAEPKVVVSSGQLIMIAPEQ